MKAKGFAKGKGKAEKIAKRGFKNSKDEKVNDMRNAQIEGSLIETI